MIIEDFTYYNFLLQPDEKRLEFEMIYSCMPTLIDVDCTNWTWGDVKFCQDMFTSDLTYSEILEVAQKSAKLLTKESPSRIVFNTFFSVKKSIEEITKLEAEAMNHRHTAKEMAASDAVGGFARFGTIPQTISMVGVIAQSINDINSYPWSTVFNAMVYKHTEGLFNKELYK